jgi:DNA-binding YbaB/EbfC family protein
MMKGMNMNALMKQAQKQMRDMQRKMKEVEDDLHERIVEGSAGGGMVRVLFDGTQEVKDVRIDPVVMEEGAEFLQEMVLAAIRQGLAKSRELEEQERGKVAGGMGLPGLEGLL